MLGYLLCIPAVVVIVVFFIWGLLRRWVTFHRFPIQDYKLELEFIVFFLLAGVAGWLSIVFTQKYWVEAGNTFNLVWLIGVIISFVILEFAAILALAQVSSFKGLEDIGAHDFIALGTGYAIGVLVGAFQRITQSELQPLFIFKLDQQSTQI